MQPEIARNQRKFSPNDAHKQTVQRVHQVQEDLLFPGGVTPQSLRRRRGRLGGGESPPRRPPWRPPEPPGERMAVAGDGRHHRLGRRHCSGAAKA